MNLIPLLAALVPWAATPLAAFTRIYVACSILSLEMQLVTWLDVGSLRSLAPINILIAAASIAWHLKRRAPAWAWVKPVTRVAPWPAVAALAALVAALNLWLPVEAADPYQLDRVAQIERLGTLGYDMAANPKVNVAGAFYELMVADLRQLPMVGPGMIRLHGLIGLSLYLLTLAAIAPWLPPPASVWGRCLLLVVPVVFHQLILLKNDLFLGAPALVALAWLISSADDAPWADVLWAAWLVGMAVGSKQVHAPLALVMVGGLWTFRRRGGLRATAGLALGGLIGGACAGLPLTLLQNAAFYGDILATGPVSDMRNLHSTLADALGGAGTFAMSLVDLGLGTPRLWPGRGGWGGTFGLPFVWAVAVLVPHVGRDASARRALACAGLHMAAFALVFPDADVAQRLVLAPGLLVIVAATAAGTRGTARWTHATLVVVVLASAAQLLRSAVLYTLRP